MFYIFIEVYEYELRKWLYLVWNRVKKNFEIWGEFWGFGFGCFLGYIVFWLLCCYYYLLFADYVFDSWFSVYICSLIDKIEYGKEYREDDAGNFVNFVDIVVGFGFSRIVLYISSFGWSNRCWSWRSIGSSSRFGDGGEFSIFG